MTPPEIKAPPNAQFVELSFATMDDGNLLKAVEDGLAKMLREFEAYENETGDMKNKCKLGIEIQIKRTKRTGSVDISYTCKATTPQQQTVTSHNFANGRLLGLHDKSMYTDADRKQLTFFNKDGEPKQTIDTETGEVVEPPPVAGSIA